MENVKTKIEKIMEKESAIKVLNDIKNKIGGVDLSNICDDESDIFDVNSDDSMTKRLIQAIQCGLVYWDENENTLVQKLIYPIKCGEVSADHFKYSRQLTMNDLKGLNTNNQLELFACLLSQITC